MRKEATCGDDIGMHEGAWSGRGSCCDANSDESLVLDYLSTVCSL